MAEPQDVGPIAPSDFRRADGSDEGPQRPRRNAIVVALLLFGLAAIMAFTFLAHPVRVLTTPVAESVEIDGGPTFAIGDRFLMLSGRYRLRASLAGHHPIDQFFEVPVEGGDLSVAFRRLPGRLTVTTDPAVEAEVRIDGERVGTTPLVDVPIEAGEREVSVHSTRWLPERRTVDVEGMEHEVALAFELSPAWADVEVRSEPPGAELFVDDESIGVRTPVTAEILAGERVLTLRLEGYKTARARLDLTPSQALTLPSFELQRIDGLLVVSSEPSGATVTIDDEFRGRTPLEVELRPNRSYRVDLFKAGHLPSSSSVRIEPGVRTPLRAALQPERGELRVAVGPAGTHVLVDGVDRGPADQVLQLPAVAHQIEFTLDGYAPYRTTVTPRPEFPQEIALTLKTIEQARRDAIRDEITAANGQLLKLIRPDGPITLGASRREPGRRANEVLREVTLTRPFYVATTEVTNAQYRAFEPGHDSDSFEQYDLDGDAVPVVNLSWSAAVRYCNWLSEQDGLRPVYRIERGEVRGFDPDADGYRLPTEAEWAWIARREADGSMRRFPWGSTRQPPENRLGNFSDRAASNLLARSITDYTDGYVTTAPVGNYAPNRFGLHDLGGNVAEWINDFYAASADDLPGGVTDPLGPGGGEYHVIRGSSWMHGQLVDLRMSFRDYGRDGRPDVGFRIVRWLE